MSDQSETEESQPMGETGVPTTFDTVMERRRTLIGWARHLLGGLDMSWRHVLVFAVVTGVVTGLVNEVPFLYDTSFRDIAVTPEWWVLFGMVVACNCKGPGEAALKCGVFFLVSQPIVYVVEMPWLGYFPWEYYSYWFVLSLFTFPAGALAYLAKRQDRVGSLLLAIPCVVLVVLGAGFVFKVSYSFPHHLLSAVFCFGQVVVLVLALKNTMDDRLVALGIALVVTVVSITILFVSPPTSSVGITIDAGDADGSGTWSCQLDDPSFGTVEVEGDRVKVTTSHVGSTRLVCTDENGDSIAYDVTMAPSRVMSVSQE
jgi:hypothetical protein